MENELTLRKSFKLNASVSKVWDALTKPELVKQYFFGTEITTDWKKGNPIFYRGVWDSKPYEDKGISSTSKKKNSSDTIIGVPFRVRKIFSPTMPTSVMSYHRKVGSQFLPLFRMESKIRRP